VIIVALSAGLTGYASVLLTRFRLEFVDGLRSRVYAAVARAEWRHLIDLRQSDLLSAMTVNFGSVSVGAAGLLSIAVTTVLVVVQLVVAARISPAVTLLAALASVVLLAVAWPLVGRSRRLGRDLLTNNQRVYASMTGFFDGIKLAKAHGLEEGHVDSFTAAVGRTRAAELELARASAVSVGFQLAASAAVLALIVDVAVERWSVDLAGLIVIAFIFNRIVPQVTAAQRSLERIAQSVPAFEELMKLVEVCEEVPTTEPLSTHRRLIGRGVSINSVAFSYQPNITVLHDVSLDIGAGETVALVGPSGAGKTTLADLAIGLLRPSSGTITVDGADLHDDVAGWRRSVALVPQEPFLFHDTVRANLSWAALDADEADIWVALDTAAAKEFVEAMPNGLDTVVGDRGTRLSGGERQRIALARALLRRPEFLVLDEATSSLDSENERAIRDALTSLRGNVTTLVIAHRLSTVRHADLVVVLDAGRIVESGAWSELAQRNHGRLRALIEAGAVE